MKRIWGGAAILAAVVAVTPLQVNAQRGGRGFMMRGQDGPLPRPGVEMILRQREALELTESQVGQLNALREESVQRRTAHQAQMEELRSKVRAGEMKVEELRAVAESRRTAAAEVREQQQERVDAILTDAQKEKLDDWGAQARAYRMGRMHGMRGQRPGMRGGRGPGAMGFRRRPGMGGGPGADFGPGFGPPEGFGPGDGFGPGAGFRSGGLGFRGGR